MKPKCSYSILTSNNMTGLQNIVLKNNNITTQIFGSVIHGYTGKLTF